MALQKSQTAHCSTCTEHPQRTDPRSEHQHDCTQRHRGALPPEIRSARHDIAAGDNKPIANGESARPTIRCHGMSRNQFHRLYAKKYITHGGPKVAIAPAIAPGTPPPSIR